MPESSGPRWRKLACIACRRARKSACGEDPFTMPAIPHISGEVWGLGDYGTTRLRSELLRAGGTAGPTGRAGGEASRLIPPHEPNAKARPLTPALSPLEGERENHRQSFTNRSPGVQSEKSRFGEISP